MSTNYEYEFENQLFALIPQMNFEVMANFIKNSSLKKPSRWSHPYISIADSAIETQNDQFASRVILELVDKMPYDFCYRCSDMSNELLFIALENNMINSFNALVKTYGLCQNALPKLKTRLHKRFPEHCDFIELIKSTRYHKKMDECMVWCHV